MEEICGTIEFAGQKLNLFRREYNICFIHEKDFMGIRLTTLFPMEFIMLRINEFILQGGKSITETAEFVKEFGHVDNSRYRGKDTVRFDLTGL